MRWSGTDEVFPLVAPTILGCLPWPTPEPEASSWSEALKICDSSMKKEIAEALGQSSQSTILKSDEYTERKVINHNCESVQSDKWKELGSVRGYVNYMEIGLCDDGRYCSDPRIEQVYMFYGISFPWETFGDRGDFKNQ